MASRRLALVLLSVACAVALWRLAATGGGNLGTPLAAPLASGSSREESKPSTTTESAPARFSGGESAGTDDSLPSGTVHARCVDEHGVPIAGVELRGDGDRPFGTSAADGRLSARLPAWRSEPTEMSFAFVERVHRKHRVSCRISPGEVCELGDILLLDGGRIVGCVVGPEGQGVPRILVGSVHAESARWSTQLDPDSSTTTTADDGSFVLEAVPAGAARVVAYARGCAAASSEPFQLHAGAELTGVEVRLSPPVTANRLLTVRVLDPQGKLLPEGVVIARRRAGDWIRAQTGKFVTPGVLEFDCRPEELLDLRASDFLPGFDRGHERFAPAYAFGVRPSEEPVELRLQACSKRALLVVDAQGKPIEQFSFRMLDEHQYRSAESGVLARDGQGLALDTFSLGMYRMDFEPAGSFLPGAEDGVRRPDGRAGFCTPQDAFVVQVDAPGFAPAEAGPFPGEGAPNEIRVVLQAAAGLRGRLVADGKGVGGAAVRLLAEPAHDPGQEARGLPGIPAPVELFTVEEVKSAADGTFTLRARDHGRYLIRVGVDRASEVQYGPFEFEPRRGLPEICIELPRPGAIDGRVLAATPKALAGHFALATRNFGAEMLSVPIDAEGRFRFERVPPGRWSLRECPVDPNAPSSGCGIALPETLPSPELPCTCEVRAGETARVEFDLRKKIEFVVHVELPGWEETQWELRLSPLGSTFGQGAWLGPSKPDVLRVALDQPGEYCLNLHGSHFFEFCGLDVAERIVIAAGRNDWTLGGATGELKIVSPGDKDYPASALCESSGNRRLELYFSVRRHGEQVLHGIPAGRWRLVRPWDRSPIPPAAFELASGTSATLEVR